MPVVEGFADAAPFLLQAIREGGAAAKRRGEGLPSPWGGEVATGAQRREDRGRAAPRDFSGAGRVAAGAGIVSQAALAALASMLAA